MASQPPSPAATVVTAGALILALGPWTDAVRAEIGTRRAGAGGRDEGNSHHFCCGSAFRSAMPSHSGTPWTGGSCSAFRNRNTAVCSLAPPTPKRRSLLKNSRWILTKSPTSCVVLFAISFRRLVSARATSSIDGLASAPSCGIQGRQAVYAPGSIWCSAKGGNSYDCWGEADYLSEDGRRGSSIFSVRCWEWHCCPARRRWRSRCPEFDGATCWCLSSRASSR